MNYGRIRIKRYKEILSVFSKHGFGLLLKQLKLHYPLRKKYRILDAGTKSDNAYASAGKRLRLALEELGPAFIKLGQLLSMRQDILPVDITEELRKLQDSVSLFPFCEAKKLVEEEFNDKLENVYEDFEEVPVAAASISQVHCAKLITGEKVAVKVQRPEIEKVIMTDLRILKDIAHFVDNHTKYGELYDFSGMVTDFENTIKNELDFIKEGENADTLRKNLSRDEGVTVPEVKWIYTTKRVLTMEYIEGIKINDINALEHANIDRKKLAKNLATSICNQVLIDGFFHADPHPGNIRVLSNGTVVFLDLGMIGYLNETQKGKIIDFFIGLSTKDSQMVVRSMLDMEAITDRKNIKNFENDVQRIIDKYLTLSMSEIKISELIHEVFDTVLSNHMKIPREFTMLAKTIGTLQGLLEILAPDMNTLAIVEPIAKKLIWSSFSVENTMNNIKKNLINYKNLFEIFPTALQNILRKVEDDNYAIQYEMKDKEKYQKRLERNFHRLIFSVMLLAVSIIIAGILISSGLNTDINSEMYLFNAAALKISLILFIMIALGLLFSIIRSKR